MYSSIFYPEKRITPTDGSSHVIGVIDRFILSHPDKTMQGKLPQFTYVIDRRQTMMSATDIIGGLAVYEWSFF